MSEAALQAILKRLEDVANRLERLEGGAGAAPAAASAGGSLEIGPSVNDFDALVSTHIKTLVELTGKIGNDQLKQQIDFVEKAVNEQRRLLVIASQSKKPDAATIAELLKPTADLVTKAIEVRDKARGNALWNQLSAISEGIPAFGWVAVSPTPGPYVHEYKGNAEFYTNKLLREFKGKDQNQVDWCNHWSGFLGDLQNYVKKYHTTELAWNPRGGDAKSVAAQAGGAAPAAAAPAAAAAGAPPGPPPPGPPPVLAAAAPSKPGVDPSKLFAELNKGDAITSGLKHVTKEQKTKNQQINAVVPGEIQPKKAAPAKAAVVKKGPARLELGGNKWTVENYDNNKELVIEGAEPKHVVYLYKLDNCVVKINQKVNAISIDTCKKTAIVFHSAISSVEIVNSSSIDVQGIVSVPSYTVDKCSGVNIYLSKDGLESEITTAKSDAMNVLIPGEGEGADIVEMAIPEQFKTIVKGGKLHTSNVEHV